MEKDVENEMETGLVQRFVESVSASLNCHNVDMASHRLPFLCSNHLR